MNKSLVCRVLVPLFNREWSSISTGYAIKQGVVLLSRHALLHDSRDTALPIKLVWDEWKDDKGKPRKIEAEQGSECFIPEEEDALADIALLQCQTPPDTPLKCYPLFPNRFPSHLRWEAHGFPKGKQLKPDGVFYDATTVIGVVKASNSNGSIELSSTDDFSDRNDWAGISGAAIFHDTYLIGVITYNWIKYRNSLEGYSLSHLVQQFPPFAERLGLNYVDDIPIYFPFVEQVLVKTPALVKQLTEQIDSKQTVSNPVIVYQRLVSVSVGEFFQRLLTCRKQGGCPKTLGELATVMLPQFVAPEIVSFVREQASVNVLPVPYARGVVIESLMARVDRRVVAINLYAKDKFITKYALSWAAETAERTKERLQETMQDMDYRHGGDLLALHTQQLYKKIKPSDVPNSDGDLERMERRVKRLLQSASERNAPRHYLVHQDGVFGSEVIAQQYYELLKRKYPECVVIKPTMDEDLIDQELDDYFDAENILAPYINGDI